MPYLATPVILVYHTLHFTFPRHVPMSRGPSEGNTTQSVAMSHPGAVVLGAISLFFVRQSDVAVVGLCLEENAAEQ